MRVLTLVLLGVCLAGAQETTPDPKYSELAAKVFAAAEGAGRDAVLSSVTGAEGSLLVKAMNFQAGRVLDSRKADEAFKMYTASCGAAKRLGDTRGSAACALGVGLCLRQLNRPDEAVKQLDEATRLFQSAGDHAGASAALNAAGVVLLHQGLLREELAYLTRAIEEANASGDEIAVAQTNTNLGNNYKALGRYTQAIQCFERAIEITERRKMDRQSGWILNNLGSTAFELHDMEVALSYLERSLAIKEKKGDPEDLASTLVNLAAVHNRMGQYVKAIAEFRRVSELAEKTGEDRPRALAIYNWGIALRDSGKLEEAKERLQTALALTEKTGDRPLAGNCTITLAEIVTDQGKAAEGLAMVQPLASQARDGGDLAMLERVLDVAGVDLMSTGRLDEAEAAFDEGIRATEAMRDSLPGDSESASSFFSGNNSLYQHMVQLQVTRGRPAEAFQYAEKSRGRTLMDVLARGRTDVSKAMTRDEQAREAALAKTLSQASDVLLSETRRTGVDAKKIAEMRRREAQARGEYRAFEVSLYAAHPELKVRRGAFEPVMPAELMTAMPGAESTALLEYSVTDKATELFVITAGGRLSHFQIPVDRDRLSKDVKRFREQVATRDLGYRGLGMSLYRELMGPAREVLRGKKTIVLAPDDFLWQLPFQALVDERGRHLMEDYAISYAPSLSVLHEMRKMNVRSPPAVPRLLAVEAAGVDSARQEMEGLRAIYGAANTKELEGGAADGAGLRREAAGFDVVHVAAHGFFSDANPMSSYLLVAKGGKREAGMLEAREMMDLNLRASVVVLSGCETGRVGTENGEGLTGMAWALFVAGSPSTVASQWRVEASSTTSLMLAFHRNLRKEGKAAALQQAALQVMKMPAYKHPFYWSGFVLMGDGQ